MRLNSIIWNEIKAGTFKFFFPVSECTELHLWNEQISNGAVAVEKLNILVMAIFLTPRLRQNYCLHFCYLPTGPVFQLAEQ